MRLTVVAILGLLVGAFLLVTHSKTTTTLPVGTARVEELDLCADAHSLAFMLTPRMRSIIQFTSVTEETVSLMERNLDRARSLCGDTLNAADSVFLASLYEMLGERFFAAERFTDSKREIEAAYEINSRFHKPSLLLWDLQELAGIELKLGNQPSADQLVLQQEQLARDKSISSFELAHALKVSARINFFEGHYRKAIGYFLEAKSLDHATST
jgi:tetratricopeptide (TPR) repeat protein